MHTVPPFSRVVTPLSAPHTIMILFLYVVSAFAVAFAQSQCMDEDNAVYDCEEANRAACTGDDAGNDDYFFFGICERDRK